jgi:hypothetical protein
MAIIVLGFAGAGASSVVCASSAMRNPVVMSGVEPISRHVQRQGAGHQHDALVRRLNSLCITVFVAEAESDRRAHERSERQDVPAEERREFPSAIRTALVMGYWDWLLPVKNPRDALVSSNVPRV